MTDLTGIERTRLESVRDRVTVEDFPDHRDFAVSLDDEGCARLRPATLSDQLDQLVATWLADAGFLGEVGSD